MIKRFKPNTDFRLKNSTSILGNGINGYPMSGRLKLFPDFSLSGVFYMVKKMKPDEGKMLKGLLSYLRTSKLSSSSVVENGAITFNRYLIRFLLHNSDHYAVANRAFFKDRSIQSKKLSVNGKLDAEFIRYIIKFLKKEISTIKDPSWLMFFQNLLEDLTEIGDQYAKEPPRRRIHKRPTVTIDPAWHTFGQAKDTVGGVALDDEGAEDLIDTFYKIRSEF